MHRFANPTRFLRLASIVLPYAWVIAIACIGVGTVWGLFYADIDYKQGDSYRIIFIHVPAAFMSQGVYVGLAVASAIALIWKHAVADMIAKASAPIGATFCFICFVTGAIWGKPTWGTWFYPDARIISVMIQFFLYVGYMALWEAIEEEEKAARAAGILAMVGVIMVPIIKFSVDWWNTLHQGATVITLDGPRIDNSMLWPLLLCFAGFLALYIVVLIYRSRLEISARQVRMMRVAQANRHAAMQPAE